jgi:hypothetical protein
MIYWETFLQYKQFLHSEIFLAYTISGPTALVMLKTRVFRTCLAVLEELKARISKEVLVISLEKLLKNNF